MNGEQKVLVFRGDGHPIWRSGDGTERPTCSAPSPDAMWICVMASGHEGAHGWVWREAYAR